MVEPTYRRLDTSYPVGSTGQNDWGGYVSSVVNGLAIPARNFSSIQAAVDEAIGGIPAAAVSATRAARYEVYIGPGTYSISEPIKIYGAIGLTIRLSPTAYISPAVSMDAVFDVCGCSDFTLIGGTILIPNGVVIQKAIHIRSNQSVAAHLTKRPYVGHVKITRAGTGHFVTGLQVGEDDSTLQCDEGFYERIGMSGLFGSSLYGIRFAGAWGNNLNHLVQGCYVYYCDVAYDVYRVNTVAFNGCTADGGDPGSGGGSAAYHVVSLNTTIDRTRVEAYKRLLLGDGLQTADGSVSLRGVEYKGQEMADNDWIKWSYAGGMILDNVRCEEPAFEPHIKLTTAKQVWLQGQVIISSDTLRPAAEDLVDGAAARGSLVYRKANADTGFFSGEVVSFA